MNDHLEKLLLDYKNAPDIYHTSSYWEHHLGQMASKIKNLDWNQLRSGRYPEFATFGFNETTYHYRYTAPFYQTWIKKAIRSIFITHRSLLPYSMNLRDIREMAYNHCHLQAKLSNARPVSSIETSDFGSPQDVFNMDGKKYTMRFFNMYVRYAFFHNYFPLKGEEVIVELGSGSGHQTEILKKLYPKATILLFDLPHQLFLCERYLTEVLGQESVVSALDTLNWAEINSKNLEKGKVHFFGNWKFPLLKNFRFDVFWNAASFGEMEPHIVKNYLSIISNNMNCIYLLQARAGKETKGQQSVKNPINFSDYRNWIENGYELVAERDAMMAHKKLRQGRSYFEAVWKKR